jgi:transposase
VTGANRHDVTQLEKVLDSVVYKKPNQIQQNLCADKGYFGKPALQIIIDHQYIPHVRARGEEAKAIKNEPGFKARRWIVEVAHAWFNRFRKILVRYEKLQSSYEALLYLAAAIIAYRKIGVIYG